MGHNSSPPPLKIIYGASNRKVYIKILFYRFYNLKEHVLYKLLTFQVQIFMSFICHLVSFKEAVKFQDLYKRLMIQNI